MTDYSKLNYLQLVQIANNDSLSAGMSDQDYESLSSELWKKFHLEKQIAAQSDLSARRRGLQSPSGIPTSQPSLFRSGD